MRNKPSERLKRKKLIKEKEWALEWSGNASDLESDPETRRLFKPRKKLVYILDKKNHEINTSESELSERLHEEFHLNNNSEK